MSVCKTKSVTVFKLVLFTWALVSAALWGPFEVCASPVGQFGPQATDWSLLAELFKCGNRFLKRSILCDQNGSQQADIFSSNPKDILVYRKIKQQSSHLERANSFPLGKQASNMLLFFSPKIKPGWKETQYNLTHGWTLLDGSMSWLSSTDELLMPSRDSKRGRQKGDVKTKTRRLGELTVSTHGGAETSNSK